MTKIQIIIDDGESLKGLTCDGIEVQELIKDEEEWTLCGLRPRFGTYQFTANHIIFDESPNLISIPDELLLRIRDHNTDTEHQYAVEQTKELKEEIENLKRQVYGWELRRDLVIDELERYADKIDKIIDKYPRVAAEIALENGNLDAACYFAEKANEEEKKHDWDN